MLTLPRRRLLVGAGAALITRPSLVRANMMLGGSSGAPAPLTLVRQNSAFTNSSGVTNITVSLTGTALGNLFTAYVSFYAPGGLASHDVITNNGTSFFEATGTYHFDVSSQEGNFIWYGINAAVGSVTFTADFGLPGGSFPQIYVQEWSGNAASANDEGIGNSGTSASLATISAVTSGGTTRANSLILSGQNPNIGHPTSVGGSQTLLTGQVTNDASYQLTDSLGATITHTYTYAAANISTWAIAAFK